MSGRLGNVDRETPMLLPVEICQWVSGHDLSHFVILAVETMRLPALTVNQRSVPRARVGMRIRKVTKATPPVNPYSGAIGPAGS